MKRVKRLFAILLALLVFVSSINFETVYASDADQIWYNKLFSSRASAFYLTCQPDSAVTLSDRVELSPADLSPNYLGGVVDLPRLQSSYKYVLSEQNKEYQLPATLYPTLAWTDKAVGTETMLYITDLKGTVVCTMEVVIPATYDVSITKAMAGIDYYYKATSSDLSPDGTPTEALSYVFVDASSNVVNDLLAAGDHMRYYDISHRSLMIYNHEMHKSSIVMPRYIYTTSSVSDFTRMAEFIDDFRNVNFDHTAYLFARKEGENVKTEYNVKEYSKPLTNGSRPGLLFYGSKTAGCSFDNNTGVCTTITSITDTDPLYYFIATNERCYFSKVYGAATKTELSTPLSDTPIISWTVGKKYSLKSGTSWLDAGFVGDPDPKNPNYMDYGPVDITKQLNYHLNGNLSTDYNADEMAITPSRNYCEDCNWYIDSLIYNAAVPHFASVTMNEPSYEITVNYYYKEPNADSWTFLKSSVYNASEFSTVKLEKLPERENHKEDVWYTDPSCNAKINQSSYSKTKDQFINVYGQYTYSSGHYNVVFIDDNAKTKETRTFKVTDMPTLPDTPEAPIGYDFANWMIVNSASEMSGTFYDPETFVPAPNVTYYFRAVWDTVGVIAGIDLKKTTYYVGESIDKSTITVYARTDDTGKTTQLKDSDYTFNTEVVRKVGSNAVTITYKKTGYTYTFQLTGLARDVVSIEAEYTGGKVKVGSTYNSGAFKVTAIYSDKSTSDVQDFSITPSTCAREGENTVTINHLRKNAICTVIGIKADTFDTSAPIEALTASYTGKMLNVGDKIKANDITVVATYADGEKVTLANSDFTFSPTTAEHSGDLRVTCTFKTLTGSCTVPVLKESASASTGGQDDSGSTPSTDDEVIELDIIPTPDYPSSGGSSSSDSSSGNDFNFDLPDYTPPDFTLPDSSTGNDIPTYNPSADPSAPTYNQTEQPIDTNTDVNSDTHTNTNPEDKGTSTGYLNGANILTNTLGVVQEATLGSTTLTNMCRDSAPDQSLYVSLVNDRTGNSLTPECLQLIKDKNLSVYITMSDTTDSITPVANWIVMGNTLADTGSPLDLNVMFEKTDKNGERLLYIAPASSYYPMGMSLTVNPVNTTYGSGDLIRQYSCTPAYTDCLQQRAFTWEQDNYIPYDLFSGKSVCLSDAMFAHEDGTSLLADPYTDSEDTSTEDPEEEKDDATESLKDMNVTSGMHTQNDTKRIAAIVACVFSAVLAVTCITIIVLKRKRVFK